MIRPRMLRGIDDPDLDTSIEGFSAPHSPCPCSSLPGPTGSVHRTARVGPGEATERWRRAFMVVSTTTEAFLKKKVLPHPPSKWWQLYVFTDRGVTGPMLAAGASGHRLPPPCMMTVDFQDAGLRHRDSRHRLRDADRPYLPSELVYDSAISWDDLPWIREQPRLPLLLKGILTGEDAALAVEAGVDGIVVSNHGGRQLDGVAAGITALPEVVDAVAGRAPVLMDGGVRRGTDVLKALGLGASAVLLVGRPCAWGLAVNGEQGVVDVLEILRAELRNAMILSGCRTLGDISSELITPSP